MGQHVAALHAVGRGSSLLVDIVELDKSRPLEGLGREKVHASVGDSQLQVLQLARSAAQRRIRISGVHRDDNEGFVALVVEERADYFIRASIDDAPGSTTYIECGPA